jgi:hypothetical protein
MHDFQQAELNAQKLSRNSVRIAPCEVDYPTPSGDLPDGTAGSLAARAAAAQQDVA